MGDQNESAGVDTGKRRAEIDAGRTGDKVANPDPAAAPLHADAETAGTPTPQPDAAADLDRQERIAAGIDPKVETAASRPQPGEARRGHRGALILILLAVVLGAALVTALTLPG